MSLRQLKRKGDLSGQEGDRPCCRYVPGKGWFLSDIPAPGLPAVDLAMCVQTGSAQGTEGATRECG